MPREGSCCPTSYDCSRSLKVPRQIQQRDDDEAEEEADTDSIDFFSLLFGSDEPPEDKRTETLSVTESTTLPPFKALPTTEKSFFDFIRAGLEIIDRNADKIDSSINDIVTTPKNNLEGEMAGEKSVMNSDSMQSSTEKRVETTTQQTRPKATMTTRKITSSTMKPTSTTKSQLSSTNSIKSTSPKALTKLKTATTKSSGITAVKSSTKPGMKLLGLN